MPREVKAATLDELSANIPIRLFDRVQKVYQLPAMPVIVADRIAQQLDDMPDLPPGVSYPAEWYGVVAPPFKRFFVEHTSTRREPQRVKVQEFGGIEETLPPGTTQRGVAVYDATTGDIRDILDRYGHKPREGTRWMLACFGFTWSTITNAVHTFPGPSVLHLDEQGRMLDELAEIGALVPQNDRAVWLPPDAGLGGGIVRALPPLFPGEMMPTNLPFALKAIGAMHLRCEADEVIPTRDEQRRQRSKGITLHKYYVLRVKPTTPRSVEDFKKIAEPAAVGHRAHRVRGHFRYYSEERPLFGRISGGVFIKEHSRGKDDYGTIQKDYEPEGEPNE